MVPAAGPTLNAGGVIADRTDILTLHSDTSSHSPLTLRLDVLKHLLETTATTPGRQDVDQPWSYRRALPTVLLYDDYGLDVYDRITGLTEYYPYSAEVEILKRDAPAIAQRVFGAYGKKLQREPESEGQGGEQEQEKGKRDKENGSPNQSRLLDHTSQKWGDFAVGVNNQGVNGSLGVADKRDARLSSGVADSKLANGPQTNSAGLELINPSNAEHDHRGVLVELGAGSLKKTSLLLRAVAGLLKPCNTTGVGTAPVDGIHRPSAILDEVGYYALDLEYKQLALTLDALVAQHSDVVAPPSATPSDEPKVTARGLCASYDDAVPFFQSGSLIPSPSRKVILWLGSSLGNFSRAGAASFLRSFAAGALDSDKGDTMLIGIDGCHYKPMVEAAYNDGEGVTREFILNAVGRTREVLGLGTVAPDDSPNSEDWSPDAFEYADRWNAGLGRHEAYLRATRRVVLDVPPASPGASSDATKGVRVQLEKGELVAIERSYKYSLSDVADLFERAQVRPVQRWTDKSFGGTYGMWAVEKPGFWFDGLVDDGTGKGRRVVDIIEERENKNGEEEKTSLKAKKEERNAFGVPTVEEWEALWKAWDTVTLDMIPRDMLHEKPIDLRHICLFYLGHIPAFRDIHLARWETTVAGGDNSKCEWRQRLTEPGNYADIFERGIDPNMDDPTKCHDHSEVPTSEDDWPKLAEIVAYAERVRARVRDVYATHVNSSTQPLSRKLARVLSMVYEHEALHLETLLYMLAQAAPGRILPPPGFAVPDWESLAVGWEREVQLDGPVRRAGTADFEKGRIVVGLEDSEDGDEKVDGKWTQYEGKSTGWDNEAPRRDVEVEKFRIDLLPVSNVEYANFLKTTGYAPDLVPSSWLPAEASTVEVNGVSPPPTKGAQARRSSSPSSPSQSPTRRLDAPYEVRVLAHPGKVSMRVAAHWPVQASGQQLSQYAAWKGGRLPTAEELRTFYQSEHAAPLGANGAGGNVGFRNWHPVPSTLPMTNRDGTTTGATNGGVWEWTSSDFTAHEGFVPSKLYPGYSADFHDGCHSIVLGGSWATVPRIAGRVNSFTNWYQTNYPYVFAGARVAYDL